MRVCKNELWKVRDWFRNCRVPRTASASEPAFTEAGSAKNHGLRCTSTSEGTPWFQVASTRFPSVAFLQPVLWVRLSFALKGGPVDAYNSLCKRLVSPRQPHQMRNTARGPLLRRATARKPNRAFGVQMRTRSRPS